MTEQIRLRIDRQLAIEAGEVCREIGITPTEAVSLFFFQLVKLRALPFNSDDCPELEEYRMALAKAAAEKDSTGSDNGSSRSVYKEKASEEP
jgi:addiction module RelB/DinJ family antitoxin